MIFDPRQWKGAKAFFLFQIRLYGAKRGRVIPFIPPRSIRLRHLERLDTFVLTPRTVFHTEVRLESLIIV